MIEYRDANSQIDTTSNSLDVTFGFVMDLNRTLLLLAQCPRVAAEEQNLVTSKIKNKKLWT
jgi:hypothetical protein